MGGRGCTADGELTLSSLYSFGVDAWTEALTTSVHDYVEQQETYDALPGLFIARTDAAGAEAIEALPGVRSARATTVAHTRIVWAINEQCMIAVVSRRELRPNGVATAVSERLRDGVAPYPTLSRVGNETVWGIDPVREIPTRSCFVAALNISLETGETGPYDSEDAVNLATAEASQHLPVVVAAGNFRESQTDRFMNGWALAPHVISVGATDATGNQVAPYSRIGGAPGQGPTLVACGVDQSGDVGTSFAAPVVSEQLARIAAALLVLRSVVLEELGRPEGAPLVGRCFVDLDVLGTGHGFRVADFENRTRHLPALPIAAVHRDVVRTALPHARVDVYEALPRPRVLRSMLIASARTLSGQSRQSAGAGVVSTETTLDFLSSLSFRQVFDYLAVVPVSLRGADPPVFDADLLGPLLDGAAAAMIGWANDLNMFREGDEWPEPIFVERPPGP